MLCAQNARLNVVPENDSFFFKVFERSERGCASTTLLLLRGEELWHMVHVWRGRDGIPAPWQKEQILGRFLRVVHSWYRGGGEVAVRSHCRQARWSRLDLRRSGRLLYQNISGKSVFYSQKRAATLTRYAWSAERELRSVLLSAINVSMVYFYLV